MCAINYSRNEDIDSSLNRLTLLRKSFAKYKDACRHKIKRKTNNSSSIEIQSASEMNSNEDEMNMETVSTEV